VFALGFLWIFISSNTNKSEIYIKTGDTKDSLMVALLRNKSLKSPASFRLSKALIELPKVYPGKYLVKDGMNNRELINMFKYGKQTDISFRFGNNIFPFELFGALGRKFEADSAAFQKALMNPVKLEALGLDSSNLLAVFWSDTYHFPWTINPDKLVDFFINDQQRFWDSDRFNKLAATGLKSSKEVYILASIIEKEAVKAEELPIMAGVYLNRLRINMPLQADPTVKYASGIKFMKRVTGILDIESPYNTYLHTGLPPGPIGIASKKGVDAVLNYNPNEYLYFCAKEDFSGYHNFAKTYKDHQANAKLYRTALDKKGIR